MAENPQRQTGLARTREAARYINVSLPTIYKWIEDGTLPHVMVGSHKRIPWVAIYEMCGEETEQLEQGEKRRRK